jgi:osmotically inducible protein OsmC
MVGGKVRKACREEAVMPVRTADARWEGSLEDGKGTMRFSTWEGPYSFVSRFEEGPGTNPEELIAAAHAGCYSMALAGGLSRAGHVPDSVNTTAKVHIDKGDAGFKITRIELQTDVRVSGIPEQTFQEIAETTKKGCPVSQALEAVPIELTARVVE